MSDPKRLLQGDSDADALERALLESLHDEGPSSTDKAAMWQGLSAGVIAAGVVSGSAVAASSAVASSGVASASAKVAAASAVATGVGSALPKAMLIKLALLTVLGGASVGGIALYQSHKHAARPKADSAAPASRLPAAAPAPLRPALITEPKVEADAPQPTPKRVHSKAKSVHAQRTAPDLLARESTLLTEARAALRGGDVLTAQRTLDLMLREFPRGVLAQEREVLAIDLLLASGKRAEAQASAARFVERHPESPHSARLERLLK